MGLVLHESMVDHSLIWNYNWHLMPFVNDSSIDEAR